MKNLIAPGILLNSLTSFSLGLTLIVGGCGLKSDEAQSSEQQSVVDELGDENPDETFDPTVEDTEATVDEQTEQDPEVIEEVGQDEVLPADEFPEAEFSLLPGFKFRGSDTVKDAFVAAIAKSAVKNLVYEGTGSGNGAKCLLGSPGDASCPTAKQTIAPMSRPFTAAECKNGKVKLASHVIALDAVNVLAKADQVRGVNAQISIPQLRSIFAGGAPATSKGDATDCKNPARLTTWAQISKNAKDKGKILAFRRDDLSGTTDTFKSIVGIKAFCPDVVVVKSKPTESDVQAIKRITSTTQRSIAYAGDSSLNANKANAPLAVSVTAKGPFVAPNAATVRLLLSNSPKAYPLSRRLFLNEAVGGPGAAKREPSEKAFLNWALGTTNPATFEAFNRILVSKGFVSCSANLKAKCVNFEPCK